MLNLCIGHPAKIEVLYIFSGGLRRLETRRIQCEQTRRLELNPISKRRSEHRCFPCTSDGKVCTRTTADARVSFLNLMCGSVLVSSCQEKRKRLGTDRKQSADAAGVMADLCIPAVSSTPRCGNTHLTMVASNHKAFQSFMKSVNYYNYCTPTKPIVPMTCY